MRAGGYYALAAVLLLATVPMYRYIFARARELERPQPSTSPAVVRYVPAAAAPGRRALLPGEECHGGYVFLVNGSSYRQALDASGRAVSCEGSFYLDP